MIHVNTSYDWRKRKDKNTKLNILTRKRQPKIVAQKFPQQIFLIVPTSLYVFAQCNLKTKKEVYFFNTTYQTGSVSTWVNAGG